MSSNLDLYSLVGEPIVVIRKRYLAICDNNHCATALLDEFYAHAERAAEYGDPRYDGALDPCIYTSFSSLISGLFGLFDLETVRDAFMLLITKGYIKAWQIGEFASQEEAKLKVLCDQSKVDQACEPYFAEIRARQVWRSEPTKSTPQPTPEEIAEQEQEQIYTRERLRVEQNLKRARKLDLPATLTIDEWLATLNYFEWKCAYCQINEYVLLEHFIPLSMDGGTTQGNCVPSCPACNGVKRSWHPYQVPYLHTKQAKRYQQGLKRVHEYLVSCGCTEVAI